MISGALSTAAKRVSCWKRKDPRFHAVPAQYNTYNPLPWQRGVKRSTSTTKTWNGIGGDIKAHPQAMRCTFTVHTPWKREPFPSQTRTGKARGDLFDQRSESEGWRHRSKRIPPQHSRLTCSKRSWRGSSAPISSPCSFASREDALLSPSPTENVRSNVSQCVRANAGGGGGDVHVPSRIRTTVASGSMPVDTCSSIPQIR